MLATQLPQVGFDVLAAVSLEAAHAICPTLAHANVSWQAPSLVVVGNTRALWPRFLAWLAAQPDQADPFDRYVETQIAQVTEHAFFAHRPVNGQYVPMQRLAVAAGLGHMSPSQLLIHPVFGPWISLRAIVPNDGSVAANPHLPPPMVSPARCEATCATRCASLFATAQRSNDWRAWLAVRQACAIGRDYEFTPQQSAYHYSKDLAYLASGSSSRPA